MQRMKVASGLAHGLALCTERHESGGASAVNIPLWKHRHLHITRVCSGWIKARWTLDRLRLFIHITRRATPTTAAQFRGKPWTKIG
jgi:hypothetical protein